MRKQTKNLKSLVSIVVIPVHTTTSFAINKTTGAMNVYTKSFQMSVALTLITYMLPININIPPFGTQYKCTPSLSVGHSKIKNQNPLNEYVCLPTDLATANNVQKM